MIRLRVPGSSLAAALLCPLLALGGCSVHAADQAGGVREPAVAGQFYPGDARVLAAAIDLLMKDARPPGPDRPIAIVAPHAGYVYSGQIAADAWSQAAGQAYDTVILLGTNHTTPGFDRVAVYPGRGLRTPLGTARADQSLASALLRECPDCVLDASVHAREHSVEVQVPFAQTLFPNAPILAAVVGSEDPATIDRFGRALAKVLSGRQPLIVASTDLSHWPSRRDAIAADRRTLEAMATLDADRLRSATSVASRTAPDLATCACGEAAVLAAMAAAKALGAARGRVVSYANSGDLPVGEPDRVVGYGAVVYGAGQAGADSAVLLPPSPAALALPPTAADKKQMLALARETIRRFLETGTVPLARGFSASLDRPQGIFVTLKKRDELRGCIGQMVPDRPLRVLVGSMALAAAFQDSRFSKVRAGELKDIVIEISVLTPFKDVAAPSAIVVGRDGVVLQKDRRSAVFLPQVAVEERWTRDVLLDNLCLKAGLLEGCWRTGARLSTFQADVFREGDFK
jgi:AmmeMemoRadiSam system protein B/AmmeMemoRadiSam system protein A